MGPRINTYISEYLLLLFVNDIKSLKNRFNSFWVFSIANIKYLPEVLIYVQNSKRKIDKEKDNIYDNASEATLHKIDALYEEGLKFISEFKYTRDIKIIRFNNNFDLSVEENVEELLSVIKSRFLSKSQV